MAVFVAFVAVPAVAAFKFATCVVLATVNGAVPVATVDATVVNDAALPITAKAPVEPVLIAKAVATPVPSPVMEPTAGVTVVLPARVN